MTKKTIVKAGIIGSGFAARFHFDALQRVYSTKLEIQGVYSRNLENSRKFSEEKEIKHFDNIIELIDVSDVLHICTPPVSHEALAVQVLAADKNVIIEKPFTGYFGTSEENFNGDNFSREEGLIQTIKSIERMLETEKKVRVQLCMLKIGFKLPPYRKRGK